MRLPQLLAPRHPGGPGLCAGRVPVAGVLAAALAGWIPAAASDAPAIDAGLIARWTFDEAHGEPIRDTSGALPAVDVRTASVPPRTRGVHGSALDLRGAHGLRVAIGPKLGALAKLQRDQGLEDDRRVSETQEIPTIATISFSAWTRPEELGSYREIFRQECDRRLLFSFQIDGTILSLGLNVEGYLECDARIDPREVLDGEWHHAAATFDGRTMRVYLDGAEIGSLAREGRIAVDLEAPAFIGSSSGSGEHFQGALDDLRIWGRALSADEVALLWREGAGEIERASAELAAALAEVYERRGTFADTIAGARRALGERALVEPASRERAVGERAIDETPVVEQGAVDRGIALAVLRRLRTDFPAECAELLRVTGTSPLDYLVAPRDGSFESRQATRLVELLVEYRPLTEEQWRRQSPEEIDRWEEVGAIEAGLEELAALGADGRCSPRWIETILEAGRRVTHRPHVHEAVAPYRPPHTPPTRDLTEEEARDALRRDWLHQADGSPTPERIRSEIARARELAERIATLEGIEKIDELHELHQLHELDELDELDELERRADEIAAPGAAPGAEPSAERRAERCAELYIEVREAKRRIAFRNPLLDFDRVLFVDGPYPDGSEWPHETRHRLGYMAVPGGRLLILEGLHPGGKLTQIMPRPPLHGSFWRPDLSFDATRALVSFKPHNEKSFHIYEVAIDGQGGNGSKRDASDEDGAHEGGPEPVQLTGGIYDDLDPIYLPDGEHILFSTTRAHTYVRCMPPTNAFVLARADRDGRNIYIVSQNNEPDYLPSLLDDGRVIYTRWEYTDKPLWRAQKLWTMNPDGTHVAMFWGNQSVWPDLVKDARAIAGTNRVMVTGSAHHDWFSGSVGIVDISKGLNFPDGIAKVTADVPWPECGNGPVDPIESPRYRPSGRYDAYYSPYPLGEEDFLVSARRDGKFRLYLMDVHGNRELIYEGVHNIFHAIPVRPRRKPPAIVDRVAWPSREESLRPKGGVLFSANVTEGMPPGLRGKVRALRVLNIDPKTYTYWYKRPYISTGPVVSAVQSEGVKRILGTVPVEEDGSVHFKAPTGLALHFQLLDERGRALQTMRSFVGVMPGEERGCVGCHEQHSKAPPVERGAMALRGAPDEIEPPPWGEDTVGYPRYVQPVLDRHCGSCHQGDGEARAALDLTMRPGFDIFTEPYLTLIGRPSWGAPYVPPAVPPPGFGIAGMIMVEGYGQVDPAAYRTTEPMKHLSYASRLVEIASSGEHHGVKVDPVSLARIIGWVDAMCPYVGEEEIRTIPDPEFQGVDWLSIRPRIETAPKIGRPGPVD